MYCCSSVSSASARSVSRAAVVFLFKQKTAYEMRISDGSSDVCSSDLPAVRIGIGAQLRHPERQRRAGKGMAVPAGANEQIGLAGRRRRQNGRASGRERVWQYV